MNHFYNLLSFVLGMTDVIACISYNYMSAEYY